MDVLHQSTTCESDDFSTLDALKMIPEVKVSSPKNSGPPTEDLILCFIYDTNLVTSQMRRLCPTAKPFGNIGRIRNYTWTLSTCGRANIVPCSEVPKLATSRQEAIQRLIKEKAKLLANESRLAAAATSGSCSEAGVVRRPIGADGSSEYTGDIHNQQVEFSIPNLDGPSDNTRGIRNRRRVVYRSPRAKRPSASNKGIRKRRGVTSKTANTATSKLADNIDAPEETRSRANDATEAEEARHAMEDSGSGHRKVVYGKLYLISARDRDALLKHEEDSCWVPGIDSNDLRRSGDYCKLKWCKLEVEIGIPVPSSKPLVWSPMQEKLRRGSVTEMEVIKGVAMRKLEGVKIPVVDCSTSDTEQERSSSFSTLPPLKSTVKRENPKQPRANAPGQGSAPGRKSMNDLFVVATPNETYLGLPEQPLQYDFTKEKVAAWALVDTDKDESLHLNDPNYHDLMWVGLQEASSMGMPEGWMQWVRDKLTKAVGGQCVSEDDISSMSFDEEAMFAKNPHSRSSLL